MESVMEGGYEEYQMLVKELIDFFQSKGFTIKCADYEGFEACKNVKGHELSVIARDANELTYLGLAKTSKKLDGHESREAYQVFSDIIATSGNSRGKVVPLYIIVPEIYISKLIRVLANLGLSTRKNIHYLKV